MREREREREREEKEVGDTGLFFRGGRKSGAAVEKKIPFFSFVSIDPTLPLARELSFSIALSVSLSLSLSAREGALELEPAAALPPLLLPRALARMREAGTLKETRTTSVAPATIFS
jgi:hypothetical protein